MKYSKLIIFLFLIGSTQLFFSQENAATVVKNAQIQAKAENKNVLVFFHASWCGWCKLMEKKMNSPETKEMFESNYVLASLVVLENGEKKKLENPGSENLMNSYSGKNAGLPYFVFINSDGVVLENSLNEKSENLGCPSTKEEIESFIVKLQKTSNLNEEQLAIIAKIFVAK